MQNVSAIENNLVPEGHNHVSDLRDVIGDTLARSIDRIAHTSKRAITMVYALDEMMDGINKLQRFVGDINSINKKAGMLSVNASIEAVRAGEAGKNFGVVASEVRIISDQIKTVSLDMKNQLQEIAESVSSSYGILQEIANVDLSDNIDAKDRLDNILLGLISAIETASALNHPKLISLST